MKRILFLIIMISVSIQGYTQEELNNKFKPIPPKEIATKIDPPAIVEKPDSLQVNPDELFKDTSLYKKEANVEGIFYRRNQYLGSFKTKSLTSTIRYRDAAFVDGDKIKVYLNDQIIVSEVSLNGEFQEFKITLVDGINKIDFEALNEGFASPNTAEFQVYDDKGVVIKASQWNVGTGYKATIIVVKE
ncbi:hypothetical protein IUY40_07100 [Flavobacterium sp. ALJ2]|uniref:hypothetical protein n=1 Tax=Flavobacterium sp. ALJ2 TaxID=2786960 RepID=UPI0018A0EB11|nr:hypothetical protein [Flavobacterium sp. ALJ2]MBF7091301.1 hypothetical protein [Flavobacterium sp. ALJ2]